MLASLDDDLPKTLDAELGECRATVLTDTDPP